MVQKVRAKKIMKNRKLSHVISYTDLKTFQQGIMLNLDSVARCIPARQVPTIQSFIYSLLLQYFFSRKF